MDVPAIAQLTALTRLELIYYDDNPDMTPLQNLRLEELILVDCELIAKALFVPGALTALQKLHITDHGHCVSAADYQADLENPASEGYLPAHQLRRMGAIVLGLPSLRRLSGWCSLLEVAMAEELKGWHRSKYRPFSITEYDWSDCKHVWTKPAQ